MTTCQIVSAGWQPASRVRQDAGLPIACYAPIFVPQTARRGLCALPFVRR